MPDITDIAELHEIQKKFFISDINRRSSDGAIVLYVPTEHVSDIAKSGSVSRKQLENLSKKLSEKYSTNVEIVYLLTARLEKLGQGIEMLLKANYPDIIEEISFTFLTSYQVNVWIKTSNIDERKKESLQNHITSILNASDITSVIFQWINESDRLPSPIEILVMTKKLQPATVAEYILNFSLDYQAIYEKWINGQLDKLIKKDLVVRDNSTKRYSLTGKGLGIIPTTLSKNSSDISRALELGRRKW